MTDELTPYAATADGLAREVAQLAEAEYAVEEAAHHVLYDKSYEIPSGISTAGHPWVVEAHPAEKVDILGAIDHDFGLDHEYALEQVGEQATVFEALEQMFTDAVLAFLQDRARDEYGAE